MNELKSQYVAAEHRAKLLEAVKVLAEICKKSQIFIVVSDDGFDIYPYMENNQYEQQD